MSAIYLPSPDGRDHRCPDTAWWRLTDGSLQFAGPGQVYGFDSLDAAQADALCVLAACAWARGRT